MIFKPSDIKFINPLGEYFLSDGSWSMIDLVEEIIKYAGHNISLWICTYSLSEASISKLDVLMEEHSIHDVEVFVSREYAGKKPDVVLYLANVAHRVFTCDNHAKMIIIDGDMSSVLISGSSNFSRNRHIELGVINIGNHWAKHIYEIKKFFSEKSERFEP